jgi:hypothetical protein
VESSENELSPLRVAARELRVPARWLLEETRAGRFPSVKCGSRTLVHTPTIRRALLDAARGKAETQCPDSRHPQSAGWIATSEAEPEPL